MSRAWQDGMWWVRRGKMTWRVTGWRTQSGVYVTSTRRGTTCVRFVHHGEQPSLRVIHVQIVCDMYAISVKWYGKRCVCDFTCGVCRTWVRYVHEVCGECARYACDMCTIYVRYVYIICTICVLYVYDMCTIYIRCVYDLCTVCIRYVEICIYVYPFKIWKLSCFFHRLLYFDGTNVSTVLAQRNTSFMEHVCREQSFTCMPYLT